MLEAKIKVLASVYTALLMTSIMSLLLFSGFSMKPPLIKGKTIQATIVDISQLKPRKNTTQKKIVEKKQTPKVEPEKQPPPVKKVEKEPIKKEIKKEVKKDPPIIAKIPPVVKEDPEEKKRIERKKKLEEIRKKRKLAEERRKVEEQKLNDIQQEIKEDKEEDQPVIEPVGNNNSVTDERNKLMALYQLAVISSVERQWNKPASANKNLICYVKVRQLPGGGVMDATIASPCNANSIVKNSIIAAIKKADPLPYKGFESVFDRTATFIFQPRN